MVGGEILGGVTTNGTVWVAPEVCDLCPHPVSAHVLWPPDGLCGGWMHCAAEGCIKCWHEWPAVAEPDETAGRTVGDPWLALGLDLRLLTSGEGGRRSSLLLDAPFRYRANWGLAGMPDLEQVGAPVFCSSVATLPPGGRARVVIVPMVDQSLRLWRGVRAGDAIRLFEGARVCGLATVVWVADTWRPVPARDEARFCDWVSG
jgi:hypothetical protein